MFPRTKWRYFEARIEVKGFTKRLVSARTRCKAWSDHATKNGRRFIAKFVWSIKHAKFKHVSCKVSYVKSNLHLTTDKPLAYKSNGGYATVRAIYRKASEYTEVLS